MEHHSKRSVPPLGVLLVAEGLITQEQLEACLLLQTLDYAGVQLGQILVRCGYISTTDLQQALQLQADIKATLVKEVSAPTPCRAFLVQPAPDQRLIRLFEQLHVTVSTMRNWQTVQSSLQTQQPDCLLITADCATPPEGLFDELGIPVWFVPALPIDDRDIPGWFVAALTSFAEHVRELVKSCKLLKQQQEDAKILAAITRRISSIRSAHDGLEQLMIALKERMQVEAATLYRVDRAADRLMFEIVYGPGGQQLEGTSFPTSQGVAGWVARNKQPLLIPNVTRDARFEHTFDRQTGFRTRSMLCVPLIAVGDIQGVLQLINKTSGESFSGRDLTLLRTVATVAALLQYVAKYYRS